MNYRIRMRRTINNPQERAARLEQLYQLFTKRNEADAATSRQTETATPARSQLVETNQQQKDKRK